MCSYYSSLSGWNVHDRERLCNEGERKDVQKVQATSTNWTNPFVPSDTDDMCQLPSETIATKRLEDDLLMAYDKGNKAMKAFIKLRLVKAKVSFFDPIPRLKLSTFASLSLSSVKIRGKEVMLKADRNLFARLLIAAPTRNMDLRGVFTRSLGPHP